MAVVVCACMKESALRNEDPILIVRVIISIFEQVQPICRVADGTSTIRTVANAPRTSIAAASIKPRYCTLLLQCSGAGLSHDRSANQHAAASWLPARICYKSGPRRRGIQISPAMTSRRISILKIRKVHIKSPKAMTGHQLVPDGTR